MKMISSTSSTSISGVTLILALCPPPDPIAIAINESPRLLSARFRGRRQVTRCLFLIGQQAKLVHSGRADVVHALDHPAILCPRVSFDENALVGLAGQFVLNF